MVASTVPTLAFEKTQQQSVALADKAFFKPDLAITTANMELSEALGAVPNQAWNRFFAEFGADSVVYINPRSGAPSSITLRVPLIPGNGVGNSITGSVIDESFRQSLVEIDAPVVGQLVRNFVERNHDVLAVDVSQLGETKAGRANEYLWQISIPQQVNGIPVRFGRVLASINHGNLILLGTEHWGNVHINTSPALTADDAVATGQRYTGVQEGDKIWKTPALEIVPFAPQEYEVGEAFAGPIGQGYGHRLVWSYGLFRQGGGEMWEVLVDAHSGELIKFEDTNHYATQPITGGVYPSTNTGICPTLDHCGTMQTGYPMPWANTGFASPDNFTNSAGLYNYTSGTLTTTLSGKFVNITDNCGAISESSATGALNLGGVNGQHDCTTAGTSPGDTPSSRSAFYEVNKLKEQARGWLPANLWLQGVMQTNVNIALTCNAFYSPGAGTINFYRSGGGCGNTGEIAAVFDHEWGHAMDDNDTVGALSNSSEAYADIAWVLRGQSSCVGFGFWLTADQGCGPTLDGTSRNGNNAQTGAGTDKCELDCSGVRGVDWDRHANHTPDTPANFVCGRCLSGGAPCGRQVHCSAAPSRQAAWDLVTRDLTVPPFSYDSNTAFIVGNKLFYQGSGSIGDWYTCTCPSTSNGCGAANHYMQWITADDDNGNLADGTPHMTAIFAALNRHAVACTTPTVQNSGCAAGPTAAPSIAISTGSNQLTISWGAVPGATSYWVMRSEGFAGCDFGKARIATVAGLSYTDNDVANGRDYSYVVVAQGASEACYGPASACVTAAPQPCAGAVSLDKLTYNCSQRVNVTLVDSDLTGAGSHSVVAFSASEPTPETVLLTETPANSGIFTGFAMTDGGPVVNGDGLVNVANGGTLTVRYVDVSFCGAPNVNVDKTAGIDCIGPVISNVRAVNVTGGTADIKWDTNEASDSLVTYDVVNPPTANTRFTAPLVASHTLGLTGLAECTQHYYNVASSDAAGNGAFDDNGGGNYTFTTGRNVNPTYTYAGPPVPIPDNNPTGASAAIIVPDNKTITDLDVKVNITHTWDGDIEIRLIAPNATAILLSDNRGGSGDNFTNTTFNDEATTPISAGAAPFTGSFRPENPLSTYDGISAAGTWTLKIVDNAGADVGTIDNWEITFSYPAQQCGPSLEYQNSDPQDSCGGAGGDFIVDPGDDVVMVVGTHNNGTDPVTGITGKLTTTTAGVTITQDTATFPNLAVDGSGTSDAPHYSYTVDTSVPCGTQINFKVTYTADQGTWNSDFVIPVGISGPQTTTFNSIDVPKPIPDLATITSVLTVTGHPESIIDLNVGLTLTHTFDGDLDIFLIRPGGGRIELSTDNGGTGENFTGTIFDDEATTPISAGAAPFAGSFRPEGLLSAADGSPIDGTWTLEITDDAGVDVGNLLAWSIIVSTQAPPACNNCSVAAPGEVQTLVWTSGSQTSLEWGPAANASYYNLHRGVPAGLPDLLTSNVDSCRRDVMSSLTSGPTLTETPSPGSFLWWLVTASNGGGEGPAGDATAGPRILNSSGDCP